MSERKLDVQRRQTHLPQQAEPTEQGKLFVPPTDIGETDDAIILVADMPGVSADSVEVVLDDELLTVRGRVQGHGPEGSNLAYAEYETGDYQRTFSICDEIDRDRIEARMNNGVLTLTLPKVQPTRKKIQVEAD